MRIELLRHGETAGAGRYWGCSDVALSARGWQQMRQAVTAQRWDAIVTSPLRRCAVFAEWLAGKLALSCRYENDWREMSFGAWEGRSAAELMREDAQALRRFWLDPQHHGPPDGEPLAALKARVTAAWARLSSEPDNHRVLVVTHAGPIRVLCTCVLAARPRELLSMPVPYGALIGIDSTTGAVMQALQTPIGHGTKER